MRSIKPLLLLASVFCVALANGQVCELRVLQAGKASVPITGAIVYAQPSGKVAYSDAAGKVICPWDSSDQRFIVNALGFFPDTILIAAVSDGMVVRLKAKETLRELVVEDKVEAKSMDPLKPMQIEVLGRNELQKAACCNLAESFETNAAVDLVSSDAVTGAKQIQMLGLAGVYSLLTLENMAAFRGLYAASGMGYLPGPWIEKIHIIKGSGSVTNGFEAITGQINVQTVNIEDLEFPQLNAYYNAMGRVEGNAVVPILGTVKWKSALLMHGSGMQQEWDTNRDGFLDVPQYQNFHIQNRWNYESGKGTEGKYTLLWMNDHKTGGQAGAFTNPYRVNMQHEVMELRGMTGHIFRKRPHQSVGLQKRIALQKNHSRIGPGHYNAKQQTAEINALFQHLFKNEGNQIKAGLSFKAYGFDENLRNQWSSQRQELIAGAFGEYTYQTHQFSAVGGLRADFHQRFGWQIIPRLHLRYAPSEAWTFRASAGKGWRTANVLSEQFPFLISNRRVFLPDSTDAFWGLKPEVAWNFGASAQYVFEVNYNKASLVADVYHTRFAQQVLTDLFLQANQLHFYNRSRASETTTAQIELNMEPVKRFDVRLAYRYTWSEVHFVNQTQFQPFVPVHRAMALVDYLWRNRKWKASASANYIGTKQLPPKLRQGGEWLTQSPAYTIVHSQITYMRKHADYYLGFENMLGVMQRNLINRFDDPTAADFDAAMVWGPTFQQMVYVGVRWNPEWKKKSRHEH